MKVLLLEDDLALSDILYDHLEHNGFDVSLATSGDEALEYFVDEVFDFAIMDINTPNMTGLEVLQIIRNDYKLKTPVIMITAYQDTKHLKDAFENVRPQIETKSRRVGGTNYQVPMEVPQRRSTTLAIRWMVDSSRKRGENTMSERLGREILDASNKTGASVKKREDVHKMAESNRAFAHYRW